jgi:hypothetical protein
MPSPNSSNSCWLIDLSRLFPDAVLHGFDINIPLVPLPENVKLTQHDVLDRFPEELRETYDVVHMRLMSAALTKSQWEVAFRNVLELVSEFIFKYYTEG